MVELSWKLTAGKLCKGQHGVVLSQVGSESRDDFLVAILSTVKSQLHRFPNACWDAL